MPPKTSTSSKKPVAPISPRHTRKRKASNTSPSQQKTKVLKQEKSDEEDKSPSEGADEGKGKGRGKPKKNVKGKKYVTNFCNIYIT